MNYFNQIVMFSMVLLPMVSLSKKSFKPSEFGILPNIRFDSFDGFKTFKNDSKPSAFSHSQPRNKYETVLTCITWF